MPKVSRVHLLEERSMPWSGELLIPRSERELRRSEGSGKLIDDPLVEGSNAGSPTGERPITELWGAENSFLGMRGTQLPMRSSRAEDSLLRVRPITSSGEWRTHSSE